MRQIDALLLKEGIRRDAHLDYICAMLDEDYRVIATGSCFGNTLRCFAVDSAHQGEGLLNEIVTHLLEVQHERGNRDLFLYTKIASAKFFKDLGFYEIVRVEDTLVFMENPRGGFDKYLESLIWETEDSKACELAEVAARGRKLRIGAIVMNANPFTLGHLYLVEKACAECDLLHLFVVSEDASEVPFAVRRELVRKGTEHLTNIIYHDSGPYIISSATFPSYFLKDEEAVVKGQAALDIEVFKRIAAALSIDARYVGEEPLSETTAIYNEVMKEGLGEAGIECVIVPRLRSGEVGAAAAAAGEAGDVISASRVRQLMADGDLNALKSLVPQATYEYIANNKRQG